MQLRITRDKSADLKRLKKLETQGLIEIVEIKIEGYPNKIKNSKLPVAVLGHTVLGEMVLAGDDCSYEDIRSIIGKHNVKDAITLEAHIRNKHDYFVTEDKDEFINEGKRSLLEAKFPGLKIVTVEELEKILGV